MAATPTQRTLARCRRSGMAQVVERWVPQARRRVDLFGMIDVVALDGDKGIIGIQTTSASNASARCRKIVTECADAARAWIEAGGRLLVHGWRKKPNGRWVVNEYRFGVDGDAVTFERVKEE